MATKVTDLMVGDWIHNNYTNDNYQLWPSAFSQATNFGKRMDATLEDCNCEPVPLTDEILEQNGFKLREGCTSAWDWHNGETSVHISGNHTCPVGQTLTIYVPGGTVGAAFSSHRVISDLKIRGVHELQHALNLCRIDKKIKVKEK